MDGEGGGKEGEGPTFSLVYSTPLPPTIRVSAKSQLASSSDYNSHLVMMEIFKFPLPSELLDKRRDKFQSNFMLCGGILHYFGIKT